MNQKITFDEFYKRYYSDMMSYCCSQYKIDHHSAEEIVDDSFLLLCKQWDDFETHTEMGLLAWTRRTLRNLSNSFLRKKKPVIISLEHWVDLDDLQYDSTVEYIIQKEGDEKLYNEYLDAIKTRLTKKEWRLFECVIISRNSIKNTAEILQMNENTVKTSLKRLRTKLRVNVLPKILKQ